MSGFSPKPLLMINGDQDNDSHYFYSLELYKKLLPLYAEKPNYLKLSMPFINHQFNYDMKQEACEWLEKHLVNQFKGNSKEFIKFTKYYFNLNDDSVLEDWLKIDM
ncbi:MAG: hypothetical protein ABS944_04095 [Solibacillus sp.]